MNEKSKNTLKLLFAIAAVIVMEIVDIDNIFPINIVTKFVKAFIYVISITIIVTNIKKKYNDFRKSGNKVIVIFLKILLILWDILCIAIIILLAMVTIDLFKTGDIKKGIGFTVLILIMISNLILTFLKEYNKSK